MNRERARVVVRGAVQGVGFRPFVFRLAQELALDGWVLNSSQGVFIEVEGAKDSLKAFVFRLEKEKPPRAVIQGSESTFLDAVGYKNFEIRYSDDHGKKIALISPDIAVCGDCLHEMNNPDDRRFRYPFINCTDCGPRFSIIEELPYDRANTSMKRFTMCADCDREYHDPLSRRFHAQPNACPRCGPQLQLWNDDGKRLSEQEEALSQAAEVVRAGKILALKGIGGFQLVIDARNESAVSRLRERKRREEKPFAVMYPSLDAIRMDCEVSDLEERLLLSPESPIVLLRRQSASNVGPVRTDPPSAITASVAPGNPNLGVMLPYTPLHHLLLIALDFPVVATSGNLSDEPICIDEREALERLRGIADAYLVHDRPIVRHVDDSIVRVMCEREIVLRRARGYAPLPVRVKKPLPTILAVGAHLKNSVALSVGENIFISQHIGDLETKEAYKAFANAAMDLPRLYDANPEVIACDLHPDYLSTKYATQISSEGAHVPSIQGAAVSRPPFLKSTARKPPLLGIQHHWAHVVACMAENELEAPALGVAWDGTGYGTDGTIWGGEFLLADQKSFTRIAHLRPFRLPGGDAAVKEPRRSALGVLYEIFGKELWERPELLARFAASELTPLRQMLAKNLNAPLTSSVGRLFDAVASIVGLRQKATFEGQAAMELEFCLEANITDAFSCELTGAAPILVDWQPAIRALLNDISSGIAPGIVSAKFHNMLSEVIIAIARKSGRRNVVLTGGCFQNRYLLEHSIDRLIEEGFRPYWHQRIPPNDGGISLGQIFAATMFENAQPAGT